MTWTFNKDYRDLTQVEAFYPAYLARREQITAAGQYTYNDLFKGHIPGAEGPSEDSAIYLLQCLYRLHETDAKLTECRAAGWRDFDPAELNGQPKRFAQVAEWGIYHTGSRATGLSADGSGFKAWTAARLAPYGRNSVMVIPKGKRTNGHLISGKIIVRD